MLRIEDGEKCGLIGCITEEPFMQDGYGWMEIRCERLNNHPVRPEIVLIRMEARQLKYLQGYFKRGDMIYASCYGASEEDKQDVNANNFAFLHDLKLLRKAEVEEEPLWKSYLKDRMSGRF